MKKNKRIPDPRIGPNAHLDPDVRLNILPGRKLARFSSLRLGTNACLRSGTVLYAHSTIGNYFETGHHVVVREENRIGNHVSIWNNTTLDYGCVIGNSVKIHCNCYVAQYSVLEDNVFLAPGVILANDLYPGSRHAAHVLQGPIIKKGAQVGVNCTLLPGITIGERAVIGAGSVVTRDVPADHVAWGNPAQIQKKVSELHWPKRFRLLRADAKSFYQKNLANQCVFRQR